MEEFIIRPIARIHTDLKEKFGVPRQAGIVKELRGTLVFEPEFRKADALRGLEDFTHIWLIWSFDRALRTEWSPMVRPPRLGGNERKGVFATRSPFRPNGLALSCVKLEGVERTAEQGTVLHVSGVDMMDGTPVFDIKPYIPYADCRPEAGCGFAPDSGGTLQVVFPPEMECRIPAEKQGALAGVLANDPRPRYQNDPERVYGLAFAGFNIRFTVADGVLQVRAVEQESGR